MDASCLERGTLRAIAFLFVAHKPLTVTFSSQFEQLIVGRSSILKFKFSTTPGHFLPVNPMHF